MPRTARRTSCLALAATAVGVVALTVAAPTADATTTHLVAGHRAATRHSTTPHHAVRHHAVTQLSLARSDWTSGAATATTVPDVTRDRWDSARRHLSVYGQRYSVQMRGLAALYDLPDDMSAPQIAEYMQVTDSLDTFFHTPGLYAAAG